jgi:hypothetical protein
MTREIFAAIMDRRSGVKISVPAAQEIFVFPFPNAHFSIFIESKQKFIVRAERDRFYRLVVSI